MRIQKRQITINKDKLVKQIVLDTKPNSPVRARFESILKTRMNQTGFLTAKYYMGNLQAIGDVLKNPSIPVFQGRPQRISIPRRLPLRNVRLNPMYWGDTQVGNLVFKGTKSILLPTYKMPSKRFISALPNTVSLNLESGTTTPKAWNPLSEDYAKSQKRWAGLPVSYVMWKKTGQLSTAYQAWMARHWERLSSPNNFLSKPIVEAPTATGSRPRLATLSFKLKYPQLYMTTSGGISSMIRDSFISGSAKPLGKMPTAYAKPRVIHLRSGDKIMSEGRFIPNVKGLNRLYFPESARPMIARFSAAMGREYMKALRNSFKR